MWMCVSVCVEKRMQLMCWLSDRNSGSETTKGISLSYDLHHFHQENPL